MWAHLWRTQLVELTLNTLALLAGVGLGTFVLGTALGWLVTSYEFPGRRLFEWALVLPLALPAYVIGFAVLGLLDYAGPLQSALRSYLGPGAVLPNPRAYWGVVLVMTLVFYPYVYLLARTAFREQGAATLETARMLGRSRWQAFRQVSLPMARPSLVAGTSLAMMEALADFGTVATFGYRTLTEAVYRVWYGMFDRIAAIPAGEPAAALRAGAARAGALAAWPRAIRAEPAPRARRAARAADRLVGGGRRRRMPRRAGGGVRRAGGPTAALGRATPPPEGARRCPASAPRWRTRCLLASAAAARDGRARARPRATPRACSRRRSCA